MPLPINEEKPWNPRERTRDVIQITAENPESVVCAEAIFVNAITTLGIPLVDFVEYRAADPRARVQRALVWTVEQTSRDGKYTYRGLREMWSDAAWCDANPAHELAVIKAASENLMRFAERVRKQPFLELLVEEEADGRTLAAIPSNATPEQRARLLSVFS